VWAGACATTHLLDALASRHGVELHETPVGFKYLGDLITQGRAMFGGEESGGMSLKGHPPEKDGILACLLAAEVAAVEGLALGAVLERLYGEVGAPRVRAGERAALGRRCGRRCRRGLPTRRRRSAGGAVKRVQTTDGLKLHLDGGAWVLVRPSGTEPVARLYVEARTTRRSTPCATQRSASSSHEGRRDHAGGAAPPGRASRGAGDSPRVVPRPRG
jgi:phosphoglucomutase